MSFRLKFLLPAAGRLLFAAAAPAAVMLFPATSMAQSAPTLVQQLQAELAYQLAEAAEYSTPTYHTFRAQRIVKQLAIAVAAQNAGNPLPPQLNESGNIMEIRGTVCGAPCLVGGVPLPPPGGGVVITPPSNEVASGSPSTSPESGLPPSNGDEGQAPAGPITTLLAALTQGSALSDDGASPGPGGDGAPSASQGASAKTAVASASPAGDTAGSVASGGPGSDAP